MLDNTREWLEQDEIAEMLGVPLWRVRQVVSTLSQLGTIRARQQPMNRRKIEVHAADVPTIRRAIFGE